MNDKALHEICMFNKGFNRKNETGYRGVCFLKAWETIPACVEYRSDLPSKNSLPISQHESG